MCDRYTDCLRLLEEQALTIAQLRLKYIYFYKEAIMWVNVFTRPRLWL